MCVSFTDLKSLSKPHITPFDARQSAEHVILCVHIPRDATV